MAAMQFLTSVGSDALINTFAVNMKNDDGTINDDVDLANRLQTEVFNELSGHVGVSTKRIPMFLTTSEFNSSKDGKVLGNFMMRLGVSRSFFFCKLLVISSYKIMCRNMEISISKKCEIFCNFI